MRRLNSRKLLLAGPLALPGTYIGGIAVLSAQMIHCWDLPYELVTYNTNTVARDYGSVNRLNVTNVMRVLRNAKDLVRIILREQPGIVHFHTSRHMALLKDLALVLLLRALGCAVVGHIHHASLPTLFVGQSAFFRRLQVLLLATCFNRIILLSENLKRELSSHLGGAARRRFESRSTVLYNFTELPEARRQAPRPISEARRLFFSGNVGQQKGVFDLLTAAAHLRSLEIPAFELVLAGPFDSPAEGERLTRLISELRLENLVKLTGPVYGEQKKELFQSSDVFVLPSFGEGVPLSILEAMSYGLPVVATAVGGIPEILEPGQTGFLIAPGNPQALAEALSKLLRDPNLCSSMGAAGRRRIEQSYSPSSFLCQLESIYTGLAADPLPQLAPRPDGAF